MVGDMILFYFTNFRLFAREFGDGERKWARKHVW